MIDVSIEKLVNYAISKGLIEECDRVWAENALLNALHLDSFTRPENVEDAALESILAELIACGVEKPRSEPENSPAESMKSWAYSPLRSRMYARRNFSLSAHRSRHFFSWG